MLCGLKPFQNFDVISVKFNFFKLKYYGDIN
jgi:hypothetical protein